MKLPRKKEVFPIAWKQLLQSSYKPLSPAANITSIPSLDSCWFPETGASRKRPPLETITWKQEKEDHLERRRQVASTKDTGGRANLPSQLRHRSNTLQVILG